MNNIYRPLFHKTPVEKTGSVLSWINEEIATGSGIGLKVDSIELTSNDEYNLRIEVMAPYSRLNSIMYLATQAGIVKILHSNDVSRINWLKR